MRRLDSGLAKPFFQSWLSVKKSSSIDPERPEKAMISVLKSCLVHFRSFERHILCFHARIVEKFEIIEEKCMKPYSLLSVYKDYTTKTK